MRSAGDGVEVCDQLEPAGDWLTEVEVGGSARIDARQDSTSDQMGLRGFQVCVGGFFASVFFSGVSLDSFLPTLWRNLLKSGGRRMRRAA